MIPGLECDQVRIWLRQEITVLQYINYVHQIHNTIFIIALLSMFIIFCTVVKSSKVRVDTTAVRMILFAVTSQQVGYN